MSERVQTKYTFEQSFNDFKDDLSKGIIGQIRYLISFLADFRTSKNKSLFVKNRFKLDSEQDSSMIIHCLENDDFSKYYPLRYTRRREDTEQIFFALYDLDSLSIQELKKMQRDFKKKLGKKDPGFYKNIRKFFAHRLRDFVLIQLVLNNDLKKEFQQQFNKLEFTGEINQTCQLFSFVQFSDQILRKNSFQTFQIKDIIKMIEKIYVASPFVKAIYKQRVFILIQMRDFKGKLDRQKITSFNKVLVDQKIPKTTIKKPRAKKIKIQTITLQFLPVQLIKTQHFNVFSQHQQLFDVFLANHGITTEEEIERRNNNIIDENIYEVQQISINIIVREHQQNCSTLQ